MVSDQEEVNDMYRIMLVEDDATIVDILSRQLEKWGYLVRAVQDFDRVMEEFREFQPQLVLMDFQWLLLVYGDPEDQPGTGAFSFFGIGRYESYHGHQYGSR